MTAQRATRSRMLSAAVYASIIAIVLVPSFVVSKPLTAGRQGQPLALRLQGAIDQHLEERREAEKITGIASYISLGKHGPGIEVFSGTTGLGQETPMSGRTLFQIGSNTKAFTAVLLLLLEAEGKLTIDQTVGDWLPLYPAWKNVSIRRLLNMTSGIPNYSETLSLSHATGRDPNRHWTNEDLVDFAYPSPTNKLPTNTGWFYSNTNYILAGMIVEKASGMSYGSALRQYIFEPVGLFDTYYEPMSYPPGITDRMASGYFYNTECELYAPKCKESGLLPIVGRDLKTADISWAGPAGGIVSSPRDLTRWVRALFGGRVLAAAQLKEILSIVSTKTGKTIDDINEDDPRGFSLGLVRSMQPGLGGFWFYEGETLGYRVIFGWFPDDDLVISIALNTQPEPKEDQVGSLLGTLYKLVVSSRNEN